MTFIGYFCNHVLLSNKHVHVFYTELTCVPKLVEKKKKKRTNVMSFLDFEHLEFIVKSGVG